MTTFLLYRDRRHRRGGFTLVELLTVIAVIAILMAILIPSVSTVRRRAAISKTRSQFSQYATAYELFRAEMGYYPSMGAAGAEFAFKGNNAVLIETLSGWPLEGASPATAYARKANPRRIRFYQFYQSEFGPSGTELEGALVDGLENPNIHAVIDRDMNGMIAPEDFLALDPSLRPARELRGGVFFYSSNNARNPDWEWILSWE